MEINPIGNGEVENHEFSICHIHGKFYAGWPECPICKAQKDEEEGAK